jgi:hypothetical protein
MLQIRCTQKLIKAIGLQNSDLTEVETQADNLGDWYANLLYISRRKCVLFTNEKTLYSFLIPRVKKAHLVQLHDLFLSQLAINLESEGFDQRIITNLQEKYRDFGIAGTKSRRVLGSMTDYAQQLKYIFMVREGPEPTSIIPINRQINRVPMKAIGYKYGTDELQAAIRPI